MPKDSQWKESWLLEQDSNGDLLAEWVRNENNSMFRCTFCSKSGLSYSNQGVLQIKQHARTKKHKEIADIKKRRNTSQFVLVSSSVAVQESNNNEAGQRNEVILQSLVAPPSVPSMELCLNDRVTAAETLIVLKAVEANYSFNSLDDWQDILTKADPRSEVFSKMKLHSTKSRYIVTSGFYPYFHNKLLTDLKTAPVFTLSFDSSTFKLGGLTNHFERQVRYWSPNLGQVVDRFLDYDELGHETAEVVVKKVLEGFEKDGISLVNMLQVSRDNPNVMKAVFRGLNDKAEEAGNPKLVDAPCLLHPTHNGFRKCVTCLKVNLSEVLNDIHGFFKLSTARREDLYEVRAAMKVKFGDEFEEKLDEFFKRHLTSRWLEMLPCLERLDAHWESARKYFVVYMTESSSQADKQTVKKSECYGRIAEFFNKRSEDQNRSRVHYLIYIARTCQPFLRSSQAQKPLAPYLMLKCIELFKTLLVTVVKENITVNNIKDFEKLPLDENMLCDLKIVILEVVSPNTSLVSSLRGNSCC